MHLAGEVGCDYGSTGTEYCCTHTRVILSTCLERRSGRKRLFFSALGRLFAGHFKVMQMRAQCCSMPVTSVRKAWEKCWCHCVYSIQQDSSDCPLLWACALSCLACKNIWGCDIPFDLWFPQVCRYRPDLEWLIMLAKMLSLNDRSWSWCSEDYCRAEIRSQNKRQLTEPENFCWDYGNSWVFELLPPAARPIHVIGVQCEACRCPQSLCQCKEWKQKSLKPFRLYAVSFH